MARKATLSRLKKKLYKVFSIEYTGRVLLAVSFALNTLYFILNTPYSKT